MILSGLLGFILASIGFNIMHDACHGSYSSKKWLNDTLGLTLNALGGNAFIWKFKHNIIHHTYTNVDGIDDDIAKSPIMRQCTYQKWVPAASHSAYLCSTGICHFIFCLGVHNGFHQVFQEKIFRTELQKMSNHEHMMFWLSKVLYLVFYIALPVLAVGWQAWAIGFACMHVTMGLTLALVFQLAHVVEHAEFELVEEDDK